MAYGETLFLDEIGEMDRLTQAQTVAGAATREISKGGGPSFFVDFRAVAATNRDLE